jgi:hypothetical protein
MRRLPLLLALVTLATTALAQRGEWVTYPDKGCIGGRLCAERRLRVRIDETRPVTAVRFHASDDVGQTAGGRLRVKIDGNTLRSGIDIARRGETYDVDVDRLRGNWLVFEPDADDEVNIDSIAVMYGRGDEGRVERGGVYGGGGNGGYRRDSSGWVAYPHAEGCIGGSDCRQNGNRITVALEDRPVLGVRFNAHDNVGTRADGKLNVRIGENDIATYVDVARDGKRHEFDVDALRGNRLVISTASDDEVVISDLAVLYGRDDDHSGHRNRDWSRTGVDRERRDEGGCIGGSECGGRGAKIRIPLRGGAVSSVRFYAHDSVGTRADGHLRIRVDDEVLQDYLDIPRDGRTFTIDGHHISGDWLIIETTTDDEVVIKDVRVMVREP